MNKIRTPKIGQNAIESLNVSVKDIKKALPSLTVNSDLGGTSIVHTTNGSVVHSKDIHLYPNVNLKIPVNHRHNVGYWDMSTIGEMIPLLSGKIPDLRLELYKEEALRQLEWYNKLGYSPDQAPLESNVILISKSPYLSASWYDIDELIWPGISGCLGRKPLSIEWSGPNVVTDQTILFEGQGIDLGYTILPMYGPSGTSLENILTGIDRTYTIGLNIANGTGIYFTSPDVDPNEIVINTHINNGRGLLFYPGQWTYEDEQGDEHTVNSYCCSGLCYGDRLHPAMTTGHAEFYNWYTSIKSELFIPSYEDPDNPGTYIQGTAGYVYLSLFDITPCLSCGSGLSTDIETIYNKRADGTSSPTLGVNRLITQLDLQPVYKDALNVITGRPSTGDYVLSSHNGTMSWQVNSGGGPGPGPTPTTDEVYITEQDEITAAFNTTYNVIQMHDLSATQPDSYGCSLDHVYKHFIWSPSYGSGNYVLTTTLTTRDSLKWYGGTFNGTWHEYTSDGVGAIIKIPPATTNCKITINTFEYGDCVLSCINGSRIIFADTSDLITDFFHLGRGTQFVMVWDTYMNNWQGFLNS